VDYGDEYMILYNPYKSKLPDRIITPLIDVEIAKLGLSKGITAIKGINNPLYQQIDILLEENHEKDEIIQQKTIEFNRKELEYIRSMGMADSDLIDQVKKEYLIASLLTNRKISQKRKEELKGVIDNIEQELQTIDKKVRDLSAFAEKPDKNPESSPKEDKVPPGKAKGDQNTRTEA